MDPQITQQTREDVVQQLRQWALSRNVSLVQTEQMVMAVRSDQYDAQVLQARTTARNPTPIYQHQQQQHQQQHTFANPTPFFSFHTPFGTFSLPTMPQQPIQTISGTYLPPANFVPNMFPTPSVQAQTNSHVPGVQTTRTTFPGGEAIHQNSSYLGQQGNTTFQYSSISTSMDFTPIGAQLPPPSSVQYIQQPALPLPSIPQVQAAPTHIAMPVPTPVQPQPHPQPQNPLEPQPQSPPFMTLNAGNTPIVEIVPTPEQVFNAVAANQAPQNMRLADRFKRELMEATYFSDIPGMPDRGVQR
jgi:hypothetical protein